MENENNPAKHIPPDDNGSLCDEQNPKANDEESSRIKQPLVTTEQTPKKKSPADAFLELKDVVNVMRAELYELKEYSSSLIDVDEQKMQQVRQEGRLEAIDSLCRIHQLLFRKVSNMDVGSGEENNTYIHQLFENVEGELNGVGVKVILPTISDKPNYQWMVAVSSIKSPILRQYKPNTISKVEACGYYMDSDQSPTILKKAEIVVYRKVSEVDPE